MSLPPCGLVRTVTRLGGAKPPYGAFRPARNGYPRRHEVLSLGNRDRRGDLPAERRAHPVPPAAVLPAAWRHARRPATSPARRLLRLAQAVHVEAAVALCRGHVADVVAAVVALGQRQRRRECVGHVYGAGWRDRLDASSA